METHFKFNLLVRLKVNKLQKDIPCKYYFLKTARVAILIFDKIDFRAKTITRDTEKCYNNEGKKRINQPGNIMTLNVYALKHRTSEYMKQTPMELKRIIDKSTITAEEFTIP